MYVYWTLFMVSAAALSSVAAFGGYRDDRPRWPTDGPHNYHRPHHQFRPPHNQNQPCHLEDSKTRDDWDDKDTSDEWNWGYDKNNDPLPRPKPKPGPTPPPPPPRTTKSTTITKTTRFTTVSTTVTKLPNSRATDFDSCMRSCLTTPEYNPVCGSDGVTYTNPSRLECARSCGLDVTMSRASRCPTGGGGNPTTNPTPVQPTTPSMEIIRQCMISCPVTAEYNPVCGSNGVTYTNPSRLECAIMCGVNVVLSRNSRCPAGGITSSPTVTPPTPKPTVSLPPVTPTTSTTTTSRSSTPGLDFTIPRDILDNIFTTDYSGLIDERHE